VLKYTFSSTGLKQRLAQLEDDLSKLKDTITGKNR